MIPRFQRGTFRLMCYPTSLYYKAATRASLASWSQLQSPLIYRGSPVGGSSGSRNTYPRNPRFYTKDTTMHHGTEFDYYWNWGKWTFLVQQQNSYNPAPRLNLFHAEHPLISTLIFIFFTYTFYNNSSLFPQIVGSFLALAMWNNDLEEITGVFL